MHLRHHIVPINPIFPVRGISVNILYGYDIKIRISKIISGKLNSCKVSYIFNSDDLKKNFFIYTVKFPTATIPVRQPFPY